MVVMSSDHVTASPANATTVAGDFLMNGTVVVPTEDAQWSGNPYTVGKILHLLFAKK